VISANFDFCRKLAPNGLESPKLLERWHVSLLTNYGVDLRPKIFTVKDQSHEAA